MHKILIELDESQAEYLRKIADAHFAGNMSDAAADLVDRGLCRMLVSENPTWHKGKVYISGPISNDPDYKEKFHAAQVLLEECGFCVLSPAEEVKVEPWKEWTDYMAEALILLLQAEQVYMLKGWSTSTGACLEMKLAKKLGKLVKFA